MCPNAQSCDPQHEGSCGPSATCYAGVCFDDTYDVAGCSNPAHCGTFVAVQASCTSGDMCPGGRYARDGNTDRTLCDNAPVYQEGGPDGPRLDGPVLYRQYYSDGSGTRWCVGPSDRLNDCTNNNDAYLQSDLNRGAPTAPMYSAMHRWLDYDNMAFGTITVTTGDGSATGGGGGH